MLNLQVRAAVEVTNTGRTCDLIGGASYITNNNESLLNNAGH